MTDLSQIVNVQIDRQTETVDQANFGVPLFVYEITTVDARVATYSNIDAVAEDFAATDEAYKMASAAFSQNPRPNKIKIGQKADAETYAEALQAIIDIDDDWYALAIESVTKADILAVAAFIEARTKIFIARTADADVLTNATDDVASTLEAAEYDRTAVVYHSLAATQYIDCAWLGNCLVRDPGSQTWAYKTLNTITFDSLTGTQIAFAQGKNANIYERIAGVNVITEGKVAGGEWLDIIRGIDWLTARIKERVFTRIINAPKIPYTNAGIAIIETALREQLDIAIERSLIAIDPAYVVSVPDVLDTNEIDRQNRILKNVNFTARLAGAIHYTEIRGVVYA